MADIITRAGKGSALTNAEMDANLTNLNGVKLEITSSTGAANLPAGTTAERPAGVAGQLRYNATLGQFEGYSNTWGSIGGGFTVSAVAPATPTPGSGWYDLNTGLAFIYVDDGSSSQWVQFPANGNTGGGSSSAAASLYTHVQRVAAQSIAANSNVAISFDTEVSDAPGSWVVGSPTRITVPADKSLIRLTGFTAWASSSVNQRWLIPTKNGVEMADQIRLANAAFESGNDFVTQWLSVVAGDYFELRVRQNTAGALNVTGWLQAEFA